MLRFVVNCAPRWAVALACMAAVVLGPPGFPAVAASVPAFDHIFVILMENHASSQIIGNSNAPYINSLAQQYGLATDYAAVAHPSLPNYLALVGGSTFGITSDCTTCFVHQPNLAADRVTPSGRTWKAYMESMPSPCLVGNSGRYVQKHDPFMYFDDIRKTGQCQRVVPMTSLAGDLRAANSTPNFAWITPNLCDDMHDCSVATGDAWLGNTVPTILNSPAYTSQNSLVLITWDEDDGSQANRVATLVIAKDVPAGFRSNVPYTHYSLLKTIEQAWGLTPLTTNDANANPMSDFFSGVSAPVPARASSGVAVVHERNASASDTSAVTVSIPSTTGGDTIVAIAALRTGVSKAIGMVSDSSGAVWSSTNRITSAAAGVNGRVEIWWRANVPSGVNAVHLAQAANEVPIAAWGLKVVEVKGISGGSTLDTAAVTQNIRTTTLVSGRTSAAAADGEFVLAAIADGRGDPMFAPSASAPTSAWTSLSNFDATGSSGSVSGRAAYVSSQIHAQYQAAWTTPTAASGGGAILILKASGS
jgi:hypothetical protein